MENKDISQIVQEKIKEGGIKPISKSVFNLKRVLFWSLVGFSVVVGAISFSVTISILFSNDWYLYNKLGLGFIFKSLPYFWFVFLAIFTILGEFYYRKTLLGYRHRVIAIIGVYIILTVISGSVMYILGIGGVVDQSLSLNVPVYRVVTFDSNEIWLHPDDGFLLGKIVGVDSSFIKVMDSNNMIWNIKLDNVRIDRRAQIKIGETVKIIGEINDDGTFTAKEIHH